VQGTLVTILILLPVLAAFAFTTAFGVNVPSLDDFAIIPYLTRWQDGSLTLSALLAQHNEHRIFFPRLVMLAVARLTSFNVKAEMYLYLLCLCLICVLLFLAYRSSTPRRPLLLFVPVTFIVFTFRQWHNFVFGWQVLWGMLLLSSISALYFLQVERRTRLSFLIALASAVVASYCAAGGLVVWPVGLVELAILRNRLGTRSWVWRSAIWTCAGVAAFLLYTQAYVSPAGTPSVLSVFSDPIGSAGFFLALLGEPITVDLRYAAAAGLLMLALSTYVLFRWLTRPDTRHPALWPALLLLGLALVGIVTLGRTGYGVNAAITPRYSIFGMVALAGLYLSLANLYGADRWSVFALGVILCVLIFGTAVVVPDAISSGQAWLTQEERFAGYARNFARDSDDNLLRLYPFAPAHTRYWLEYLNDHELSVFNGAPVPTAQLSTKSLPSAGIETGFAVDTVNVGVITVLQRPPNWAVANVELNAAGAGGSLGADDVVSVTGWAVDSGAASPAKGVLAVIDDNTEITATYGLDRPDVGTLLKDGAYNRSGFEAAFSVRPIGKGVHVLTFRVLTANGGQYYTPDFHIILNVF
jgi:hypothetical protein